MRFESQSVVSVLLLSTLAACANAEVKSPGPSSEPQAGPTAQATPPAGRPHGGMLRYPDVSATQIVFVYADDLWLVPREGGLATPLASPPGLEVLPRFSPDGQTIAFVGNYDGSRDIYTIPVAGGVPERVTSHPGGETLCDWTPDGRLLFFTNEFAGRDRIWELYSIAANGGMPVKMPVPYGTFSAISADGHWLAYTPHTADTRTWKRYRGGMATDIWLYDLKTNQAHKATDWEGTDTQPMWQGTKLYYSSDAGPSHRLNIWMLDTVSNQRKQITQYADYDVKWPAIGPGAHGEGEIVFQHGAQLMLLDLASAQAHEVVVTIPGARPSLKARNVDAADTIQSWDISPSGKRALMSARGDLWSAPAKHGTPRSLTRTSGVAERDPAWSPDGLSIAYFSDATGEYELYKLAADGRGTAEQLTHGGKAFRARPSWSPDSKWITFTDQTGSSWLESAAGGEPKLVDRDPWSGDLLPTPSWSHDSRWLTFVHHDEASGASTIWLYELESAAKHQVTSGMFNDSLPVFDRKGDYLYFASSRHFVPMYGELDSSFLYAGTQELFCVTLRADQPSPLAPKSDEEDAKKIKEEKDAKDSKDSKDSKDAKETKDKSVAKDAKDESKGDDKSDDKKPREKVEIALDGFERRAVRVPVKAGVFGQLAVNDKGALIYVRGQIQGAGGEPSIQIVDLSADKPKEKSVMEGAGGFVISADGKKLLVPKGKGGSIIPAAAGAKGGGGDEGDDDKPELELTGMNVEIDPRAEWRQIFFDAWRMERDYFYDPNMHHVDWEKVRKDYEPMLADCVTREDVGYVIREMISELNVGHAYYTPSGGDDSGPQPHANAGLFACDYALEQGAWRITKIHEGAAWDEDGRGPLSQPGVDAKVGDWLLAVNGLKLDPKLPPWAATIGLAGKTVSLSLSATPTLDARARNVVVVALESETVVRYREWIEAKRAFVEKATGGKVGYVYVPSTGEDGQSDLFRQYMGQLGKSAMIIDERWNSGGQIPTRFIELLNRPVTNYWARRDGKDWTWPQDAMQGPKCMLINGLSGSGGDAFPAYFKQAKLGAVIGTRTWGGLVGLSGGPSLIDGSTVTVPTFGFYKKDGTWGVEGHGVDPDIEVIDDPSKMQNGADPQLDAAVALMIKQLAEHPYVAPKRPEYPDRSGMGVLDKDK